MIYSKNAQAILLLLSGLALSSAEEIFSPQPASRPHFLKDPVDDLQWRGENLYQYNCQTTISNYFFNLQPLYLDAP